MAASLPSLGSWLTGAFGIALDVVKSATGSAAAPAAPAAPPATTHVSILQTLKDNLALEELDYCPLYGKISIAIAGLEDRFQREFHHNPKPMTKLSISGGSISTDMMVQSLSKDTITRLFRTVDPRISRAQLNRLYRHSIKALKWFPPNLNESIHLITNYELQGLKSLMDTYTFPIEEMEDDTRTVINTNKTLIENVLNSSPSSSRAFIEMEEASHFPLRNEKLIGELTRDQFIAQQIKKLWTTEDINQVAKLLVKMNNYLDLIEAEMDPEKEKSFAAEFQTTKESLKIYISGYPAEFLKIKESVARIDQERITKLEGSEN